VANQWLELPYKRRAAMARAHSWIGDDGAREIDAGFETSGWPESNLGGRLRDYVDFSGPACDCANNKR
jgi:hypothetical protein